MASPVLLCLSCVLLLSIPSQSLAVGIDHPAVPKDDQSITAPSATDVTSAVQAKSPVVDAPVYNVNDNEVQENTWTDSIKRALHGPTGQMVVHIAKEVIARQVGGTQVLSLNLTNLLILLFLKAIIFAAGLIGAGSWGQYGRNLDNGRPVIDFGDASLMMGFLAAQGSGHRSCLYRAACEYPEAALEYAQAGHATLTGAEIFSRTPTDREYEVMLSGIEKAAKEGLRNAPCSLIYQCPLQ